ncbi:MAG: N-acetyl-gamma-glutamyl-phosphate reductase [Candidatus Marinarcus sp.]|uniref:N-acetyl-gamma-glutamyl-phosphate reductase n=1 Tax=Candidatus Marinarcus sp. TaxID=3100987 RepID=UPI003B00D1A6
MKYKIFVDGQFGTTGLKINEMLKHRDELELLSIKEEDKKDIEIKKKFLNEADLVFLCLPDEASKESVKLITNRNTKVIDASTAHRTNPDWTYGIAELNATQREKIKNSKRVCVPGCHASGFIMAMNPLIQNGIVAKSQKIVCHSITGYSGGGRALIDTYKASENQGKFESQRPYALGLSHKHLPEMKYVLGLDSAPFFTPSVGNFEQGMLVMSYLIKDELQKKVSKAELIELYKTYYSGEPFVKIIEDDSAYLDDGFLDAMKCNNTNRIEISVYDSQDYLLVISRLDNLGKGASGAAVQNMNIMLGLDEKLGLKL